MIDALAVAGICGLPVERIVDGDELERGIWLRAAKRAAEIRVQMMKAEASHVGAAVARAFR